MVNSTRRAMTSRLMRTRTSTSASWLRAPTKTKGGRRPPIWHPEHPRARAPLHREAIVVLIARLVSLQTRSRD
jgi:hypothetical protein